MDLYGTTTPADYSDGNLIRFADDILVTVRSQEKAEKVMELLKGFMDERGLRLSEDKTAIRRIEDGFTYLSRTYIRKGKLLSWYPAEKAVERFISELKETISTHRRSQRELILTLNQKLKGWAGYHRYSDAGAAFR